MPLSIGFCYILKIVVSWLFVTWIMWDGMSAAFCCGSCVCVPFRHPMPKSDTKGKIFSLVIVAVTHVKHHAPWQTFTNGTCLLASKIFEAFKVVTFFELSLDIV